jgi:hypothetical protein
MTIEYDPQNGDAATDIIDIETQEQAKLAGTSARITSVGVRLWAGQESPYY